MSIIAMGLSQTITSIASVTANEYNKKTATVIYNDIRCRWQESVTQVVSAIGEQVISKVQVWVMPDIIVKEGYRVIKDSITYVVVAYEKWYDIGGIHDHTKVYLA